MGQYVVIPAHAIPGGKEPHHLMTEELQTFLREYHNGTAVNAYMFLGCHSAKRNGTDGFIFRLWAPNAHAVSVVGDFNFWNPEDLPMRKISADVWEAWSENAAPGGAYKYLVEHWNGRRVYKTDPFAFRTCRSPDTSGMICKKSSYRWHDRAWMNATRQRNPLTAPVNIYELHLSSWRKKADGSLYSYAELAPILAEYIKSMGYTHVQLMPIAEYPFDPSWGYQVTSFYAPTSRFGSPRELMYLVDTLHLWGIGVILDWVGVHFPKDEYGLFEFDGTCTYELSDPAINEHPDWGTRMFDLGKPEVRSFLISNAVYWLEQFHFDGIRVASVDTMLHLDYHRSNFTPNRYGGSDNLEAITFLQALNRACFAQRPHCLMTAQDATDYPLVTKPDFDGGLGFLLKWDACWSRDLGGYFRDKEADPGILKHPVSYAWAENFVLTLSHDNVVHGKGSLIAPMPGSYEEKFARVRLLRGLQITTPGKKLSFMGNEFAQFTEWDYQKELDWMLLDFESHRHFLAFTRTLNHFYKNHEALWAADTDPDAFRWLNTEEGSDILAFSRMGKKTGPMYVVFNLRAEAQSFRLGVDIPGRYACRFCSDDSRFGGSGAVIAPGASEKVPCAEQEYSLLLQMPPLSFAIFVPETQKCCDQSVCGNFRCIE